MYIEAGDNVPPPAPSVLAAGGELAPLVPVLDLQEMQYKASQGPAGSKIRAQGQ